MSKMRPKRMKWGKVRIGDVAIGIYDGPHATPPPCEIPGHYFLGIPQITPTGHIDLANPRYIAVSDYGRWTKRVTPRHGDVIFSYEATLNLYAQIPEGMRCCLGRRMGLVRPDPKKLDYRFLYYYFFSPEWRSVVKSRTLTGATVDRLPIKTFPDFPITLPPLPTQKRIADILSAYDDLIENNRRRMEILEESARLIFKERFGEVEATGVLADICEEIRRAVKPSEVADDTPYIGLEHMPRRSISLCQWEGAGKVTSTKHGFNEGEILFGKIRPYFHKVGLAFVDGVASSDAIVIRPLKAELRNYVLLTVSSDDFVAAASQGMKEGSKMPRADWDLLLKYPVPIPAEKALADFNKLIEPIMQQLKALCFTNRKLAEARDVLLPKLMNEKKS